MTAPALALTHSFRPPTPDAIRTIARDDPRRAMSLVVEAHRNALIRHALHIVKDGQEACDLVQEVFIKAMRERRFFDPEFKMKAWLYRVTTNLCFNRVRDRRRRGEILDSLDRPRAIAPNQDDVLLTDQRQKHILEAMGHISEDHRKILMLRFYGDLSYAEIAEVLGIRLGTVMSRLSRAKHKLMEVLQDPGVVDL